MAALLNSTTFYQLPAMAEAQASLASYKLNWVVVAVFCGVVAVPLLLQISRKPLYPTINYDGWSFTYEKAKREYLQDARGLLVRGFEKWKGKPFYMVNETGPKLMLGPEFIDAINHEPRLSLEASSTKEFMGKLPGFELFAGGQVPGMVEDAVRTKLTQNLPKFTTALSREMDNLLEHGWKSDSEWHETYLRGDVVGWVARLSATVFVPAELADNPEWLKISAMFTVDLFEAVAKVRSWPAPLRRLACYTMPQCRRLRREYQQATDLIRPLTEKRRAEVAKAEAEGVAAPKYNDALEWVRACSRGQPYDPSKAQLGLTMAAIHTTADLLAQCIYNLCEYPEIVEPLREEAIRVIGEHGWNKISLYKLELLDSFMKETQRVKPVGISTVNRAALADVTLPGGVVVRKGELLSVTSHLMWDDEHFPKADTFDPHRFVKRRKEAGKEHSSHFVSTSPDFTAFSHGKHACPGRFFAANETKIALVHIMMKFDLKMDKKPQVMTVGGSMSADPFAMVKYKSRDPEIEV